MESIEELATFCKRKGFIFPNSEIYGGLAGVFDYGPLGVELKNNIKNEWWKSFVQEPEFIVGIDSAILSHKKIWQASGHEKDFKDLVLTCSKTKQNYRADHFIADRLNISTESLTKADIISLIKKYKLKSPAGADFEEVKDFNLLFQTQIGSIDDKDNTIYLRPEIAQLIFTNFKSVLDTTRIKFPFGIAQIGKVFRNEISPRDFLFRVREFELMEIEFFLHPETKDCPLLTKKNLNIEINILTRNAQKTNNKTTTKTIQELIKKKILEPWHAYWLEKQSSWFVKLGINENNLRIREHLENELAHYSSSCFDIEYNFPFGWKELHGCANRGQFDLTRHIEYSKKNLEAFNEDYKERFIPKVIEPSQGLDRAFLAFITEAYSYDKKRNNIVLKLHPKLAPIKVAIFPLVKKTAMMKKAKSIYEELKQDFNCFYDESASIGRRYARQDEIGTPLCITIDDESLKKNDVTIRDRDTAKQVRIKISNIKEIVNKVINGENLLKLGKIVDTRVK